jgi:hypothetical protein
MWKPAVLFLLVIVPAAVAASEVPLAKGDEVYVAATLKGIQHPKLVSGANMTYDMAPCKKLVVKKADPKKQQWVVEDLLGNQERLEGEWSPWLFKTEAECKAYTSTQGEAKVIKSGTTFKIAKNGDEGRH